VKKICIVSSRDLKNAEENKTIKDAKNVEDEKPSIEHQVQVASSESTSTGIVDAVPVDAVPKDAK